MVAPNFSEDVAQLDRRVGEIFRGSYAAKILSLATKTLPRTRFPSNLATNLLLSRRDNSRDSLTANAFEWYETTPHSVKIESMS